MPKSLQKILITGGCGFVGRVLTRQLLEAGYEVVVVDDLSNPQSRHLDNVPCYQIDAGDEKEMAAHLIGVSTVVALASRRGSIGYVDRNPTDVLLGNGRIYTGTFKAIAAAGVKNVIFFSSSMIYSETKVFPTPEWIENQLVVPSPVFGKSKLLGEWYCQQFARACGLRYAILRPTNIYGPDEIAGDRVGESHVIPELHQKITSGQYPLQLLGDGRQTRCFIHVEDVAAAVLSVLAHEGTCNESFNIGTNEEISIEELARMLWELCARPEPFKMLSIPGFQGDVSRQFLDVRKAEQILGWKARVSFRQGLKEVVRSLNDINRTRVFN